MSAEGISVPSDGAMSGLSSVKRRRSSSPVTADPAGSELPCAMTVLEPGHVYGQAGYDNPAGHIHSEVYTFRDTGNNGAELVDL